MILPALHSLLLCAATASPPIPVMTDSGKVRSRLSIVAPGLEIPLTSDWAVVGPVGDSGALLADGTQWKTFFWSDIAPLAAHEAPSRLAWKGLDLPAILDLGTTPTGGTILVGMDNGRGVRSTSVLDWRVDGSYRFGIGRYFSLGAGAYWQEFLFAPRLDQQLGDSLLPSGVGFSLSACGPFVCGELVRRVSPIDAESWLQPDLDSLIGSRQEGGFWTGGAQDGFRSAWEKRLVFGIGALSYKVAWCSDLWRDAFQSVGFWNLPAGALRFGFGLEWTRERAATRAQLAIAPLGRKFRIGDSRETLVELLPLDFSIAFRQLDEFQLAFRTGIRFEDPFSKHPSRNTP